MITGFKQIKRLLKQDSSCLKEQKTAIPGDNETLFVNTWLMSCRVLKRGMENFMSGTVVTYANEHGFKRITGEYVPTKKNGMVSAFYRTWLRTFCGERIGTHN